MFVSHSLLCITTHSLVKSNSCKSRSYYPNNARALFLKRTQHTRLYVYYDAHFNHNQAIVAHIKLTIRVIFVVSTNWKDHIHELSKKISRGIGVLLKLRRCISTHILLQVYYSIVYSFFTYGVLIWEHTYKSSLHPLIVTRWGTCAQASIDFGFVESWIVVDSHKTEY